MDAEFSPNGGHLTLTPSEYGFLFTAVNDRVCSLPEWEVSSRLGLAYPEAQALLDDMLAAESEARQQRQHWLPPKPPERE